MRTLRPCGTIVICSNCGATMRSTKQNISKELMVLKGWGKLGDACYCKECIDMWKFRNGDTFENCGGVHAKDLM